MLPWVTLFVSASFGTECPAAALPIAQASAARMELAWANLDELGFAEARLGLDAAIRCIDSEVSVADAVVFHRARALAAFVDGDDDRARRSFAAIKRLQPAYDPSKAVMPPGHPIRAAWDAATGEAQNAPLPPHAGGFNVDGLRTTEAPTDQAFVLQGFTPDGAVLLTRYCEAPGCLADVEDLVVAADRTRRQDARRKARTIGTVGASALALVAVGGFVVSNGAQAALYDDPERAEILALESRSRAGFGLGVGGAALAVTTAAVVWTVNW